MRRPITCSPSRSKSSAICTRRWSPMKRPTQLDPNDPDLVLNLGLTAWNTGNMNGAERMFRLYIETRPDSARGLQQSRQRHARSRQHRGGDRNHPRRDLSHSRSADAVEHARDHPVRGRTRRRRPRLLRRSAEARSELRPRLAQSRLQLCASRPLRGIALGLQLRAVALDQPSRAHRGACIRAASA